MQTQGVEFIVKKTITSSEDEVMAYLHYWDGLITWEACTKYVHESVCTLNFFLYLKDDQYILVLLASKQLNCCSRALRTGFLVRIGTSSSPVTNYHCLILERLMI